MDSYFWFFSILTTESAPGSPKDQWGTIWTLIQQSFIPNRWNLDGFAPRKRVKNHPQKNWSQNVSNFWDLFWQPPGLRIGANYFPRSKYSSLKVSDYLRKPCFLTFFWSVFWYFQLRKTTKIKKSKNTSNLLNFRQFHRHFRIQREISVRTVGSKVHGSSFWKIYYITELYPK